MTLFMMLRKQPRHTLHGSFNVVGRSTTERSEDVIANQITECRKYLFFFLFFFWGQWLFYSKQTTDSQIASGNVFLSDMNETKYELKVHRL